MAVLPVVAFVVAAATCLPNPAFGLLLFGGLAAWGGWMAFLMLRWTWRRLFVWKMPVGMRERMRDGKKPNLREGFKDAASFAAIFAVAFPVTLLRRAGDYRRIEDLMEVAIVGSGVIMAVVIVVAIRRIRIGAEYYWEGPGHFETITRFWHAPIAIRYDDIVSVERGGDAWRVWIRGGDGQCVELEDVWDAERRPRLHARLWQMWLEGHPAFEGRRFFGPHAAPLHSRVLSSSRHLVVEEFLLGPESGGS